MIRRIMAPALAATMVLAAPAAFARAPLPANALTNDQVRQAQMQLKDMRLYKGRIDGL